MNKTNILLIILIVAVICVGTGVCLTNMNKEKVVVVNKTVNNTTNNTVKHVNSDNNKISEDSQKSNELKKEEISESELIQQAKDTRDQGKAGLEGMSDAQIEYAIQQELANGGAFNEY